VAPEHDRTPSTPSKDLVEQRELHLPVSGTAKVPTEVGSPQSTVLDLALERAYERIADWIEQVVAVV
jgi:hypothetical protein